MKDELANMTHILTLTIRLKIGNEISNLAIKMLAILILQTVLIRALYSTSKDDRD